MNNLQNKIAVITGGNSGIGFATAQEFLAQGAEVVITGRNQEALDAAAAELGKGAHAILADTADVQQTDQLVATLKDRFGAIDILFINAGVAAFSPIAYVTERHFDTMMNINFRGAFFTLSRLLPILKDGGSVTFLSSVNATSGMANSAVYAASKAALNSLVKVASVELAPRKIRVNAVSPGPIETPIFGKTGLDQESLHGFATAMTNRIPLKRFGGAHEVAKLVSFLSSDHATFISGADYVIDGGIQVNPILG